MEYRIVKAVIYSDGLHRELRTLLGVKFDSIDHDGKEVTVRLNGAVSDQKMLDEIEALVLAHVGVQPVDPLWLELVAELGEDVEAWDFSTMLAATKWKVLEFLFRKLVG